MRGTHQNRADQLNSYFNYTYLTWYSLAWLKENENAPDILVSQITPLTKLPDPVIISIVLEISK